MDARVIALPAARMAVAGPAPAADDAVLSRFDAWFSARTDPLPIAPRDLMWWDAAAQALTWGYLLDPDEDGGEWPVVPFAGGLYASAVCRDQDDADGERVLGLLRDWVAASPLHVDESADRPVVFRILTPEPVAAALGHHQLELLLPVRLPADR
jgi:hypothetical protein